MNDVNHEPSSAARPPGLTVELFKSLSFTSVMEKSSEVWAAKDLNSKFLYGNPVLRKLSNLSDEFDMEGRLDHEVPAPWSEFEPALQEHDRKVEQSKDSIAIIGTHFFGREDPQPYIFEKFPLFNEAQECVGTFFHGRKFDFPSLSKYFSKPSPENLISSPPTDMFPEKECEVIFYALQGCGCKEIADRKCGSPRTIEHDLQRMYQKVGVNSLRCLREFCREKGFENYIPPRFLKPGVRFIPSTTTTKPPSPRPKVRRN